MERNVKLYATAGVILVSLLALSGCGGGSSSGSSNTPIPTPQISLPTSAIVVGPLAGATAAALLNIKQGTAASWTAQSNVAWIHMTDTSGTTAALGSAVRFTLDANTGATRTGTISFQGTAFLATLTVTQAGAGYTPAVPPLSTLTTIPIPDETLPPNPPAFVVDIAGNIFYLDASGNTLYEWVAASGNTVSFSLPATANTGASMAVDANQNIYFSAQTSGGPAQIYKWAFGSPTATWVAAGLPAGFAASGVTTDLQGNVYTYGHVQDSGNLSVFAITSAGQASSNTNVFIPFEYGVVAELIADAAGNLDALEISGGSYSLLQGNPVTGALTSAGGSPRTELPFGGNITIYYPEFGTFGLDGSGHFYLGIYVINQVGGFDQDYLGVLEPELPGTGTYIAGDQTATLRARDTSGVQATADDGLGNIYVEGLEGAIQKFAPVYINITEITEPATAGSDQTLPVLPTTAPINAVSSESWLTITGQSDGVITFSFTATTVARVAAINVFGQNVIPQQIYVSQAAPEATGADSPARKLGKQSGPAGSQKKKLEL